jgi:hypothetical protein
VDGRLMMVSGSPHPFSVPVMLCCENRREFKESRSDNDSNGGLEDYKAGNRRSVRLHGTAKGRIRHLKGQQF